MAAVLTPRRRALVCAWTLGLLLLPGAARAQELPTLTQPVNDFAEVIDPGSEAELDRRIRALQRTTGDVVIVTTVNTIAPYGSIEEYAVRLFERAGIGQRKVDNGLLILVAVQDRRARIEVRGTEPAAAVREALTPLIGVARGLARQHRVVEANGALVIEFVYGH